MDSEIHQLKESFKEHAEQDRDNFERINETLKRIEDSLVKVEGRLEPITDAYKAVLFSKSFITGLAAVVMAIGAVGAGAIYLVNYIVNNK